MSKEEIIKQNTILEQSKQLAEYWEQIKQLQQENERLKAENEKLNELHNEVQKVWNEDGENGEIQMKTPIAWYRVLRISEKLLTNK